MNFHGREGRPHGRPSPALTQPLRAEGCSSPIRLPPRLRFPNIKNHRGRQGGLCEQVGAGYPGSRLSRAAFLGSDLVTPTMSLRRPPSWAVQVWTPDGLQAIGRSAKALWGERAVNMPGFALRKRGRGPRLRCLWSRRLGLRRLAGTTRSVSQLCVPDLPMPSQSPSYAFDVSSSASRSHGTRVQRPRTGW